MQGEFYALIVDVKQELSAIYDSTLSDAEKRVTKQAVIAGAHQRYERLKQEWAGYGAYDVWFDEPLNNAILAATTVYLHRVPDFLRLLEACDGNHTRFYQQVERIAELPLDRRRWVLRNPERSLPVRPTDRR